MSRTIQNTLDWALPIIRFLPLTIGSNNEPAITSANIIQQTVVGPPFCWAWNRATLTFQTTTGIQDYVTAAPDFGFIEKASVTLGGNVFEITDKVCLALDSRPGRPDYIAAQRDDNIGNITFRLMKVPDQAYTVTIEYQKRAPVITGVTDTWAIPDEYQFICNYGFLSLALLHADDPRTNVYNQKFVSALLSINRGLTEMERNIFIGNWMALTRQEMSEGIRTQQAAQARGV